MGQTEKQNELAPGLDMRPAREILTILHQGQLAAAKSVEAALPKIESAAALVAKTLTNGGSLGYAAAGSSGLIAMADGLELPGTYNIANEKLVILFAGGPDFPARLTGGAEDDEDLARSDMAASGLRQGDCLICVSASGTTPYAIAALDEARQRRLATIGIANNADTPVLSRSDIAIHLNTPPEIIAGSTRMGAGTAQKIVLNMLSTLMAVHLGHVHDGYMVNVQADNAKLKARACHIIANLSQCSHIAATNALERADGSVKIAILLAAGAKNSDTARQWLEQSGDKLRPTLANINAASVR